MRTVVDAERAGCSYWTDTWRHRELLRFLVLRDLTVHYKQTVIGIAWALLRPMLTIAVFTVFGALFETGTQGLPRVMLVTPAALLWQLFSSSVSDASNSLIANTNLVTKVFFPRFIVPVSSIVACLVDFVVGLIILVAVMSWYGYVPKETVLSLPLFVLLVIMSSTGAGLLLAALIVRYRDFRYLIPVFLQLGLYVSPIAFSSATVQASTRLPQPVKIAYFLNYFKKYRISFFEMPFYFLTHTLNIFTWQLLLC